MSHNSSALTLKIGLYTPKEKWIHTELSSVAPIIAQHIDESTGMYLSLNHATPGADYRFQPLWDFDDKHYPANALNDSRKFVETQLIKRGIPTDDLIPFASGRKGIHIASRSLLSPRDDWYAVFSHMALNHWSYEFPTLDGGIYQNRALIRAPFSRHPKSVFARKKPIPWDMFWRGSFKDIQAWAQEPLTDMQWAEIQCLVIECLPNDGQMPAYWIPFSEGLVLDFRRHKLSLAAIKEAKPIVVRRRFRDDWAALLDETGLDYRERKTRLAGKVFTLEECPYCQAKHKAYVTPFGKLRCFRTSCEAHEGIFPQVWTQYLGIEIEFADEDNKSSQETHETENLDNATQASAQLRKELERIHHLKPKTALLVTATPGIGKTTHALAHVKQFSGNVIVATSTKARAKELFAQYGEKDAQLIEGRGTQNCQNHDKVQIIGQKGYAPGKVFCQACPFFPRNAKKQETDSCLYYQQFEGNPARVIFCTYEQALYLHAAGELLADLIILDEDPTRAFMQKICLQIPHLLFNEDTFPLPVRKLTQLLRYTLSAATAEINTQNAIYRSQWFKELLLISAEQMGINIHKTLSQVTDCLENVYDKPGRLTGLETHELEQVPPAYLLDLALAINKEIAHTEDNFNSELSVHVNKGVATLVFYSMFTFEPQTPLVILDAYGKPAIYRQLLKREVQTIEVHAKIHAKVINIKLATSKRAFAARHDALFRRLDEVIQYYPGKKILVYTHAALEKEIATQYPFVATQHFWSGRGVDEFKDYDVVVIFGTAEPNPQQLIDECRALYSDDSIPISSEPLPQNHRHRKDERLETLLLMRREEEMEQAAHRPRPVWAEKSPRTIVVMSHLDLPGLPADEVIDPRAIESMKRKSLLADFIADCLNGFGFYCDALAELAGVVPLRVKVVSECRRRIACTASLMNHSIRQPVQAGDGAGSLYPANRNAYTRDRNVILKALELEAESLGLQRENGHWISLKMWGNNEQAEAFFRGLVPDVLMEKKRFTMADLLAVCEQYAFELRVLLEAKTVADAYYGLFSVGQNKGGDQTTEGWRVQQEMEWCPRRE